MLMPEKPRQLGIFKVPASGSWADKDAWLA